ncbi:MAG TPA: hypothetical protein VFD70_09620 [Anaerolineae bacterium]|nr:hypothetical protein [Anaerolineae bacterium]
MNAKMRPVLFVAALAALLMLLAVSATASANHSWNGYHWARTANPFTLKLGDNVSGLWDGMLVTASNDWSQASVLDTTIVAGGTRAKSCRPTSGRVEVCSANYNNTGWLGLAQIWITGGTHITQGVVKNNDYYFGNSSYQYNNTAEMQHVICQEIGHTLGLTHTSEDGSSQNTCMDYYHNTSASDTQSTHPNSHDYQELSTIYSHLDSFTTIGAANQMPAAIAKGDFSAPNSWGKLVSQSRDGREATFVREFGGGNLLVTHVIYAK